MHSFMLNRDFSPVFLWNKVRKTPLNAAINLFMGLLCVCAIFRIKHVAKKISLLASRTPMRVEFFFSFLFMFLLYYACTCSVLLSINSRKAFKFLSKHLVYLLLYGNQYRHLGFVHKTTYLWSMTSPGVGESSLSVCPGVGNRLPSEKKIANPRG